MSGRVILTVALWAGDTLRTAERFDVTTGMDSGAVHRAHRLATSQRGPGERVIVAITRDGIPIGTWRADRNWPRASADVIARARAEHAQGAPA